MNDMTNAPTAQPHAAVTAPRVRIVTDLGDMLIALDADRAPLSTAAFMTEVAAGSFDGGGFPRIVRADNDRGSPTIAVIQGGGGSLVDPRLDVPLETTDATGLRHLDGTISLPRLDAPMSTAQGFFICIGDQPGLDHGAPRNADGLGFAAFGRVIDGMDVARAIHASPTKAEAPVAYIEGQIAIDPVAIHRIGPEAETAPGQLRDLAEDYWQFRIREFPVEASLAGVREAKSRLDGIGEADHARQALLCRAMLARADAIEAAVLGDEDATTLALLRQQVSTIAEAHARGEHHRPQLFPFGFTGTPGMLIQMTSLDTLADREDFIARLHAMPAHIRTGLDGLRAGFARGHRVPRPVVPRVLSMIDSDLAEDGLTAQLTARLARDVAADSPARVAAQRDRALAVLTDAVLPALREVRAFVAAFGADELTDAHGFCAQPGGRDSYRFRVRHQTSTDLDPDAIHAIGLEEVARIRGELDDVLAAMGRPGELAAVAAELDQRLAPDAETLLERTRAFAKRVDGLLPRLFGRMPRITYGVEPFTAAASAALPPALAQPAPADRSMPGIYWLTALPEKLPLHLIVPLTLHEAWPGHLMQLSIAHELTELPAFRRHVWQDYNGYVEGWALYCERLGHDLGLYDEPADRFGLLSFELWRAARLVVDTGIHWLGWSRDAAIDYMLANSFLPRPTVESEVDRYIAWPAQALSYKIGERVMRGLRAEAENRLGGDFSLRAFHDIVLGLGPVSLTELQRRVRQWIMTQTATQS